MTEIHTGRHAPAHLGYDELANLMVELDVFASPAELHGLLTGHLAGDADYDEAAWLRTAATYLEQHELISAESKEVLLALYAQTAGQLYGTGFDLDLMLPDEDDAFNLRVEQLGRWCLGFVSGFPVAQAKVLSEEAQESLADLSEIATVEQAQFEAGDNNDESDLVEVEEYVRMASIMIFSELHTADPDLSQPDVGTDTKPSLH